VKEIWKDTKDYDGRYQVSTLGRVKSFCRSETKIVSQHKNHGYLRVILHKDGLNRLRVHRLVALSFIPNPENKKEINHKNGIKTDNRVENLEWCTSSENKKHALYTGLNRVRFGQEASRAKLTNVQVLAIRGAIRSGYKQMDIAKYFKITASVISDINSNKRYFDPNAVSINCKSKKREILK